MLFLERILLKEFRKLTIYNNSEKPFRDDKIETRLVFLLAAFFSGHCSCGRSVSRGHHRCCGGATIGWAFGEILLDDSSKSNSRRTIG